MFQHENSDRLKAVGSIRAAVPFQRFVLAFMGLVGIRMLVRSFQFLGKMNFEGMVLGTTFADLVSAAFFYLGLFILIDYLNRSARWLPSAFLFLTGLLSIYGFFLLGAVLGYSIPYEFIFVVIGIGLAVALWLVFTKRGSVQTITRRPALDWFMVVLLIVWSVYCIISFLDFNWRPNRVMNADEGTFWAVAARVFIDQGFMAAHKTGYAGGGMHPFGVPFIDALPALIMQRSASAIYSLPLVNILVLGVFLYRIRLRPWVFFFFFTAIFAVFSHRSWLGSLMYQLVYGEGFCAVLLLWVTVAWEDIIIRRQFDARSCLFLGLGIGFVGLTKSPLVSLTTLFALVCAISIFCHSKEKKRAACFSIGMVIVSFIPILVWKGFVNKYGVLSLNFSMDWSLLCERLASPNWIMWQKISVYFATIVKKMVYYVALSTAMIIFFLRKREFVWPAGLVIIFVWLYYGYYYQYGSSNTGDHESALRYFMPSFLILFYQAGIALETLMVRLENCRWAVSIKYSLVILLGGAVMIGIF